VTITLDRYGNLFPGSEKEAAGLVGQLPRTLQPKEIQRVGALHCAAQIGPFLGSRGAD
jgi:hypothetical protein